MLRTAPPVLGSGRRELPLLPHALARHAAGPRAGQHAAHERRAAAGAAAGEGLNVAAGAPRSPAAELPRNLRLDELRKQGERFLPAEIARLWWDGLRNPFLYDGHLGTDRHLLQGYRRLHFSAEVRVVELVRVASAFMWHQLEICSAEGVAVAGGEVCERHPVGTADFGIEMVALAREAVRRKPFGHCVWIEERPIDFLGRRTEHTVEPDGVCRHMVSPLQVTTPRGTPRSGARSARDSG